MVDTRSMCESVRKRVVAGRMLQLTAAQEPFTGSRRAPLAPAGSLRWLGKGIRIAGGRARSELEDEATGRHDGHERFCRLEHSSPVNRIGRVAKVRMIQHVGDVNEEDEPAARPVESPIR